MPPNRTRFVLICAAGLLLSRCTTASSTLNPQSPAAAQITGLWWVMFWIGTAIWVGVVALLLVGLLRKGSAEDGRRTNDNESSENRWVIGGGIILPAAVLFGLIALNVGVLRSIGNIDPSDEVVIEIVGHQWWWEIRYPHQQVVTANEIHIPAGQPVEVKLTSVDVIHSFWVPELHGKFDLIPGNTLSFTLQADQPGEYRGQCAEFCGIQHARMGLIVFAQTGEAFDAWVAAQGRPAAEPTGELAREGLDVFLRSRCAECHTILGTTAAGTEGPDLTHLAGRSTLAAATLPNTHENLTKWVSDPQSVKPGNSMPNVILDSEEIFALVAYLESLK